MKSSTLITLLLLDYLPDAHGQTQILNRRQLPHSRNDPLRLRNLPLDNALRAPILEPMRSLSLIPFTFLFAVGCASIVSKSQRPVTVTSSPSGAKVTIKKSNGVAIQTGETPLTVTLETSNGFFQKASYTVEAQKAGYQTATSVFQAEVNGWYFGNILFGGIIGMLIVDPATGAMWKLEDTYSVNLVAAKKVALKSGEVVSLVSLNDVPNHLRSKLVPISANLQKL